MICPHCGTLLVEDRFMDWTARWRCLRCGYVQDSLSVERCLARQKEGLLLKSAEPDYWDEEVHLGSESFVGPEVISRCLRIADERNLRKPAKQNKTTVLAQTPQSGCQSEWE
jgi:hypothetical protein